MPKITYFHQIASECYTSSLSATGMGGGGGQKLGTKPAAHRPVGQRAIAKPQCPDNQHTSNRWAVPTASVVSKFFLMNPKLRVLINWIEKIRGSDAPNSTSVLEWLSS